MSILSGATSADNKTASECVNESCEIDFEYEKFVEGLASRKDTKTFSNRSTSHALSILRCVFKYAEKEVDIFSGSLDSCVYNDETLLRNAKDFVVQKKGKIRVLLQNKVETDRATNEKDFLNLITAQSGSCEVKVANEDNLLKSAQKHFLVADSSMYRMELDVVERTAVCSFRDEIISHQLNEVFNSAWEKKTSLLV